MNKNPTENDVIDCFIKQINEQNSTTTYDVKLEMRKNGFWVFQDTISSIINENYKKLNFQRNYNGKYFVYTKIQDCEEENNLTLEKNNDGIICNNKRGKIIITPFITSEGYGLTSKIDNINHQFMITKNDNLKGLDCLYAVNFRNETWYLYGDIKFMVDRHKAIYYVWLAVKNDYQNLLYSEIRSQKMLK